MPRRKGEAFHPVAWTFWVYLADLEGQAESRFQLRLKVRILPSHFFCFSIVSDLLQSHDEICSLSLLFSRVVVIPLRLLCAFLRVLCVVCRCRRLSSRFFVVAIGQQQTRDKDESTTERERERATEQERERKQPRSFIA